MTSLPITITPSPSTISLDSHQLTPLRTPPLRCDVGHSSATSSPPGSTSPPSDGASVPSIELDAPLRINYNPVSAAIWNEPSLRLLCHHGNPSKHRHILVVMRPGGGKTHIMGVAGSVKHGIVLVIIMLHTLSDNQMAKFTLTDQSYGSVIAHNMDEVLERSPQTYNNIVVAAGSMTRDTTMTHFLIASPQHLARNAHSPIYWWHRHVIAFSG